MTAQEFGALLRERREAKGLTVTELAERIKLSARTLQAIENGSMDGLPHAVYARGFVRSYAQQVGLDQEDLAEGLDILFPLSSGKDELPLPGPIGRQRTAGGKGFGDKLLAFLLIFVLLVLPVGAGWFVFTRYGDAIMEWVKRPFIATSADSRAEGNGPADAGDIASNAANAENAVPVIPGTLAGETAQGAGTNGETGETSAPPGGPEARTGSGDAVSANAPRQTEAPQAASAAPESASGQARPEAMAENAQATRPGEQTLQIFAQQNCWVEVRADGTRARSFELAKGESAFLPFKDKMDLTLGNAGGVTLRYNGQAFATGAKPGEVKSLSFPPR